MDTFPISYREGGMPFRGVSAMDRKREFVTFAAAEGANTRELCRRFGVAPTTGYKWLHRGGRGPVRPAHRLRSRRRCSRSAS